MFPTLQWTKRKGYVYTCTICRFGSRNIKNSPSDGVLFSLSRKTSAELEGEMVGIKIYREYLAAQHASVEINT